LFWVFVAANPKKKLAKPNGSRASILFHLFRRILRYSTDFQD